MASEREREEEGEGREQDHASGNHRHDGVAPGIAAEECRSHAQYAEADGGLAAALALDARPAATLAAHDDLVRRPRVENEPQPDQAHEDANNDWDELDAHIALVKHVPDRE